MKNKMNIFFMIPGIEICIMMIISLFMPLVSYNSDKYKFYNGMKMMFFSDSSVSNEYLKVLNSLKLFVIVALILTIVTIITFMVIGFANMSFLAGGIISLFSSAVILIMELVNFVSLNGIKDGCITTKFGFLFIMLSSICMIIYVIAICFVKKEDNIRKENVGSYAINEQQNSQSNFEVPVYSNENKQEYNQNNFEIPVYNNIQNNNQKDKIQSIQPTVYSTQCKGMILGVKGTFKGASIQLKPGESIIVGRDPSKCHLVLDNPKVSRKHCSICMDKSGMFVSIICYSQNGLFLEHGGFVTTGKNVKLTQKEKITMADGNEVLEVC